MEHIFGIAQLKEIAQPILDLTPLLSTNVFNGEELLTIFLQNSTQLTEGSSRLLDSEIENIATKLDNNPDLNIELTVGSNFPAIQSHQGNPTTGEPGGLTRDLVRGRKRVIKRMLKARGIKGKRIKFTRPEYSRPGANPTKTLYRYKL